MLDRIITEPSLASQDTGSISRAVWSSQLSRAIFWYGSLMKSGRPHVPSISAGLVGGIALWLWGPVRQQAAPIELLSSDSTAPDEGKSSSTCHKGLCCCTPPLQCTGTPIPHPRHPAFLRAALKPGTQTAAKGCQSRDHWPLSASSRCPF